MACQLKKGIFKDPPPPKIDVTKLTEPATNERIQRTMATTIKDLCESCFEIG